MEDGCEQPVAFASRTLTPAEQKYAQIDRVGLALIFGVRYFHKCLVGRSFTLVTNYRLLVKIFGPREGVPSLAAARLQRWALILSSYSYQLECRPGITNAEADMLSRLPIAVDVIDPNEQLYQIDYCEMLPVTAEDVGRETKNDAILKRVYEKTLRGWRGHKEAELKPYQQRADQLTIAEDCLIWGGSVVIPPTLRNKVLQELHEDHIGVSRMKAVARSFVWWPGLDRDIENIVRACEACQDTRHRPVQTQSHPWIYPDAPWSRLHADFADISGKQYLVIVDAFSKWPELQEVGIHATTTQTIEAMRRTFACHGLPVRLVTENRPQFTSQQFKEFTKASGIKHQLTPAYHPSSNGQAERLVQEVKKSLKSKPSSRTVSHQISIFLLRYRTTPNSTTGKTPSDLLMKEELRTRLSFLRPDSGKRLREEHRDRYETAIAQARQLKLGDPISVLNPRQDGRGKWLCEPYCRNWVHLIT